MDDRRRAVLVETLTTQAGATVNPPLVLQRFQFDNHLGSVCIEMDEAAVPISYEEYYPYGGTAYMATGTLVASSAKRYRYCGKERDEETGLYYYGARFYVPWLGRWANCDPAGLVDGPNLYAYCCCSPSTLVDVHGTNADIAETPAEAEGGEPLIHGPRQAAEPRESAQQGNNAAMGMDRSGALKDEPRQSNSVGSLIEREGVAAAERGSTVMTAVWAATGAVWEVFGAEHLSRVADQLSGATKASTSDYAWAGVELLSLGKGGAIRQAAKEAGVVTKIGLEKGIAPALRELGRVFYDPRFYKSVANEMRTLVGRKVGWTTDHVFLARAGERSSEMIRGLINARFNLWDMPDMRLLTKALGSKQTFNTFMGGEGVMNRLARAVTSTSIAATILNDAKTLYHAVWGVTSPTGP
jgi:RHS repeat-associated protein